MPIWVPRPRKFSFYLESPVFWPPPPSKEKPRIQGPHVCGGHFQVDDPVVIGDGRMLASRR
jgi:hypothetical protein